MTDPDTRPNGQRKGDSGLLRAMNNIGSSLAIVAASGGLGGGVGGYLTAELLGYRVLQLEVHGKSDEMHFREIDLRLRLIEAEILVMKERHRKEP